MSDEHVAERSALIVAALTSFLGPFMISGVNVALPVIQKEFSADAVILSWIATSYLLSSAVCLVPVGKIADIYGRKKIFKWGLIVFVLSSFLSAFAGSIQMLIALRGFQGVGAAMITTTGMAIIVSVFRPQKRGRAIGIYVAAVYIGLSVGPLAGGILTQHLSWRSIFLAMVPLGLVCIFITIKYLKDEWMDAKGEKFDAAGSLLYALALFALIYGASLLPKMVSILLILFGLTAFAGFIGQESTVAHPVFEIKLFKYNRLFAFSSLAALINYAATFAVTFLLSLYLQYIKGMSPQSAGFMLVAQPMIQGFFSPFAGKLSDRIEPRIIASLGMAITALGLGLLIFIDLKTLPVYIIGILMMLGFGFALFSSPNMNAIMSAVEKKYYGIASGAVATMRLLGQMFSMAAATVTFAIIIGKSQISPSNYDLFLKSMRICFIIFSFLCAAGIFFSLSRGEIRH
jgi:EmrB/QacA subfamily drug resistance transporter